ncbi:MAG: 8-amino-7-oxononanoate synthase [Pseudomonadota bacterium]|jgi:8-amino-7-oxononanoate synthase
MLIELLNHRLREREAAGLTRCPPVVAGRDHTRIATGPMDAAAGPEGRGSPEGAARPPADHLAFASNDYLGLAGDAQLAEALAEGARLHGVGAGASPMVCGQRSAHAALEHALAQWLQPVIPQAQVLLFPSGFQANVALMAALGDLRETVLLTDRLNHASLIDGAQLARAQVRRYPHNDLSRVQALLAEAQASAPLAPRLIVTDAVFSMDGDLAPLAGLLALAEAHDAWLVVDDAHGLGVLGPQGRGSLAEAGLCSPRLILMGTLGKALGTSGAFVAAEPTIARWLHQTARPHIYSTAGSPALAHATLGSLQRIAGPEGDARRAALAARIAQLRAGLQALLARHPHTGWQLVDSRTAIQPLIVGGNLQALSLAAALRAQGLWVPAIRPPTVPEGTARLRISLSAAHGEADVACLLAALDVLAAQASASVEPREPIDPVDPVEPLDVPVPSTACGPSPC